MQERQLLCLLLCTNVQVSLAGKLEEWHALNQFKNQRRTTNTLLRNSDFFFIDTMEVTKKNLKDMSIKELTECITSKRIKWRKRIYISELHPCDFFFRVTGLLSKSEGETFPIFPITQIGDSPPKKI